MTASPLPLNRRQTIAGLALALAAPIAPCFAQGDDGGARRKINLAGRQRMLSQRMTMAAFMVHLGIEKDRFLGVVQTAHDLFDATLAGLRHGSAELGLPEETSTVVLGALDAVDSLWAAFGVTVRSIIERGGLIEDDIATLARFNTSLLFTSDNVVKQLVSEYGDNGVEIGLAISINVSGRQRMLSQKMAKESALIALGYKPGETRDMLKNTATLFDSSLTALIEGLPSITLPPPPEHIRLKLLEVRSIWGDYQTTIMGIADGAEVGAPELYTIAALVDPLLTTMNEAVQLYEEL